MRTFAVLSLLSLLFAFAPFRSAAQEDESRRAEIASIIDLYLAGKIDEAELKALDSRPDAASDDQASAIVAHLAGSPDVDFKAMAVFTSSKPDLWALASAARFVRLLAKPAGGKLDKDDLLNAVRNYLDSLTFGASSPAALKWRDKAPLWLAWCDSSFALVDGLDPLLRKRSVDPKKAALPGLSDVSLDDFIKSKAPFAARPKPAGLFFNSVEMERYFASIENESLRKLERERYAYIKDVKGYLAKVFPGSPYLGKVRLSKGKQVSGTIALANDKMLLVNDGNGKTTRCEWEDVLPDQCVDFLSYYGKTRLNVSGPNVKEDEKRRYAGDDFAHAAVVADWYGRYQDALECARLALSACPEMKAELERLVLGR